MKSLYSCFGILIWSLLASKSNSLPDVRRASTLLDVLNNYQNNIGPYGAPPHNSGNLADPFYETLIRGSTYPTSMGGYSSTGGKYSMGGYYYKLKYAVDALVKEIGELRSLKSVCNPLMPSGSMVIGSFCYYVSSTAATYADALQKCRDYGGTLAEPTFTFSIPLWTALINAFPTQMATILSSTDPHLWIGGQAAASSNTFTYVSTGNNIVTPLVFTPALPSTPPTFPRGALMQAPGQPWSAEDQANTNPYLCWSTPLSPAGSYEAYRPYPGYYYP